MYTIYQRVSCYFIAISHIVHPFGKRLRHADVDPRVTLGPWDARRTLMLERWELAFQVPPWERTNWDRDLFRPHSKYPLVGKP